jgi:hypothetical protein
MRPKIYLFGDSITEESFDEVLDRVFPTMEGGGSGGDILFTWC